MLIQKKLLEQLINMASDSAEYLNEKWITVKPHGAESKGTHVLVKDGETNKEAVERKFGDGLKKQEEKKNPQAIQPHKGGLLSDMLGPKPQRKQHVLKVKYIRQLMDGTLLYENIKTKSMYIVKDNKFYNMKYQLVDRDFEIV